MSTVHVVPVRDQIDHLVPGGLIGRDRTVPDRWWLSIEADPDAPEVDCPCGPVVEHVPPNGWLISHHSLDGRERNE